MKRRPSVGKMDGAHAGSTIWRITSLRAPEKEISCRYLDIDKTQSLYLGKISRCRDATCMEVRLHSFGDFAPEVNFTLRLLCIEQQCFRGYIPYVGRKFRVEELVER